MGDEDYDPGAPPSGYANETQIATRPWHDIDGTLCCSVYCAAIEQGKSEEEAEELRAEAAWDDPITEEEVANMSLPESPDSERRQHLEALLGKGDK